MGRQMVEDERDSEPRRVVEIPPYTYDRVAAAMLQKKPFQFMLDGFLLRIEYLGRRTCVGWRLTAKRFGTEMYTIIAYEDGKMYSRLYKNIRRIIADFDDLIGARLR